MFNKILALAIMFGTLSSQADIEIVDGSKLLESVNKQIVNIYTEELDKIQHSDPR